MKRLNRFFTYLLFGFRSVMICALMLFSFNTLSIPSLKDIKVIDGDTIKAFYKDEMIKIRLAEIDAPETRQDFGYQSKKCLKQIIIDANGIIAFKFKEEDRYKRSVGWLLAGDKNLNYEMVRRGCAWVYDRYVLNKEIYQAQDLAKLSKKGLWKKTNPTAPWLWRRNR